MVNTAHVDENLRIDRHHRSQLGERLTGARHLRNQVQAGEDTVAGGRELRHYDVPRLLPAERKPILRERFEHIAITDTRLDHADVVLSHCAPQPEIAHHGCH